MTCSRRNRLLSERMSAQRCPARRCSHRAAAPSIGAVPPRAGRTAMPDIRTARDLFPATRNVAYFNTAATGLASTSLAEAYRRYLDQWVDQGFDLVRGDTAGEIARTAVARLIGASRDDVALIATVSGAAGLVAAQFGRARPGENLVVGEREYTSNLFAWR